MSEHASPSAIEDPAWRAAADRSHPAIWLTGFLIVSGLPALALAISWQLVPATGLLRWSLVGVGLLATVGYLRIVWRTAGWAETLALAAVGVAAWFRVMTYLQAVNTYPFSLSWSEGNRFYDYSLVFGQYLYDVDAPIVPFYDQPGRYALWGVLFAIPRLPIWAHRLWNAVLWNAPLFLLGFSLAGWAESRIERRWLIALWIFLFLMQGPIYPTLVLSALLVVLAARWQRSSLKIVAVFVAALYAGLSRWTWLFAPAAWAGMVPLLESPADPAPDERAGPLPLGRRALIEASLLVGAGLLGGVLAKPDLFLAPQEATGFTFRQPLLWYRLLPNATFRPGILLGLTIAAAVPALLLVWLGLSGRWRLNWLQIAIAGVPTLGFLAVGLVASTKIGGGSNLHNLDMFLITVAVLAALALRARKRSGERALLDWPPLARGLLALAVAVPALAALQSGRPVRLPPRETVAQSLSTLQRELDQATGEVLFMDQRQLLSFGYIQGVAFTPDYEKKYLMDQAMAGNAPFFEGFYEDLSARRFALIVSHPIKVQYQGRAHNFGEENDAWSRWVAEGILCYYRPKETLSEIGVQLLVPRPKSGEGCP